MPIVAHSSDKTFKIASEKGAEVVPYHLWQGKGYAIKFGLRLVETSYIIMMDSDFTGSLSLVIIYINAELLESTHLKLLARGY